MRRRVDREHVEQERQEECVVREIVDPENVEGGVERFDLVERGHEAALEHRY